jgi:RNA processing factor Prp31
MLIYMYELINITTGKRNKEMYRVIASKLSSNSNVQKKLIQIPNLIC